MLELLLHYRLDLLSFAVLSLFAMAWLDRWLRARGKSVRVSLRAWGLLIAIILLAAALTERSGGREASRLMRMVEGIAPTYARELSLMGHASLPMNVAPDDPNYLRMIEAEKRWLRANPAVSDIYTFRKLADGKVAFLVDSETDYDRNGQFEGERESRTDPGEEFEDVDESAQAALQGSRGFDATPYTDRWGTWVSAYVPMYDEMGRVEAVLGVDYAAASWLRQIGFARAATLGFAAVLVVILVSSTGLIEMIRADYAEREALHRRLLEASRQAGMAEVATGVLHNVGNVLNSVNVSASIVTERLKQSKVPNLGKATELIEQRRADLGPFLTHDERGKQLPDYLVRLSKFLREENEVMLDEMMTMSRGIEHIKQIVQMQQSYARPTSLLEPIRPADLFEDALRVNLASLERHNVRIVRDYPEIPPCPIDKHKVLQILINLLSNAKNATRGQTDRQITLRLRYDSATRRVAFEIVDNGVGISPENLERIFSHGFTTRTDGHGFGLHSAANAAREMGGSLQGESAGPGRGATFRLELPIREGAVNS